MGRLPLLSSLPGFQTEERLEERNELKISGKRKKKVNACPHIERKHYAKVGLPSQE
jgi:hypothetical protein